MPETEDNQLLARNAKSSLPETEDNSFLARNAKNPSLPERTEDKPNLLARKC